MKNKANNQISLQITNNLPYAAGLLIMNAPYNPNNQSNAKNYYEWDLITETFVGVNLITLNFYLADSIVLQTIQTPLLNNSIAGVVNALTSLNMGFFFNKESLIFTFNDNFIFESIIIS